MISHLGYVYHNLEATYSQQNLSDLTLLQIDMLQNAD